MAMADEAFADLPAWIPNVNVRLPAWAAALLISRALLTSSTRRKREPQVARAAKWSARTGRICQRSAGKAGRLREAVADRDAVARQVGLKTPPNRSTKAFPNPSANSQRRMKAEVTT